MAFTEADLERLNDVYWELQAKGTDWAARRESLARIYYACEAVLNERDVVAECPSDLVKECADLMVGDTTLIAER